MKATFAAVWRRIRTPMGLGIVALFIIWAAFSWYWYVCGIRGLCLLRHMPATPAALVATSSSATSTPTCTPYLAENLGGSGELQKGPEVLKLEKFLNIFAGANIPEDSAWDWSDGAGVRGLQQMYGQLIGSGYATGTVDTETRTFINAMVCADGGQLQPAHAVHDLKG